MFTYEYIIQMHILYYTHTHHITYDHILLYYIYAIKDNINFEVKEFSHCNHII